MDVLSCGGWSAKVSISVEDRTGRFAMSELFFIFIFSVSFIVLLDRQNKNVSAKFNWEPAVHSRLLVDCEKVHEENIVEMFLVGKKKVNLIYRIIKTRQN